MIRAALGLTMLLAPLSLAAQEVPFSPDATEDCRAGLTHADNPRQCVGKSARACIAGLPQGAGRQDERRCVALEAAYWDARLAMFASLAKGRAENKDYTAQALGLPARDQQGALDKMQAAWADFRDTSCAFERSLIQDSEEGGIPDLFCRMQITADQTAFLEAVVLIE